MQVVLKLIQSVLDRVASLAKGTAYSPPPPSQKFDLNEKIDYTNFETSIDGTSALISFARNFEARYPLPGYAQVLQLTVVETDATLDELAELEQQLVSILPGTLNVGAINNKELINIYFYVPSNLTSYPARLKQIPTRLTYSYQVFADPEWKFYQELLPTIGESELLANTEQLTNLAAQGIDLNQEYNLEHSVIVPGESLDIVKNTLNEMSMTLTQINTISQEPLVSEVRATETTTLEINQLTNRTTQIAQLALSNGGEYGGWKVIENTRQQAVPPITAAGSAPHGDIPQNPVQASSEVH